MPAKIKVKIVAGRDFPIMDRASDLADPFVEVRPYDIMITNNEID